MRVASARHTPAIAQHVAAYGRGVIGGKANRMLSTLQRGVVTPLSPNYRVRAKESMLGGKNADSKAKAVVFAPLPPNKFALGTWGRQAEFSL